MQGHGPEAQADAEWALWERVRAASQLHRRLHARRRGGGGGGASSLEDATTGVGAEADADADSPPSLAQRVFVWAPREYDREITADEWAATPPEVREVWQARAESLSFAVLRRCASDDDCMRRAMEIERTTERLALAMEELEKAKAVALAKLSIDGALGSDLPDLDA